MKPRVLTEEQRAERRAAARQKAADERRAMEQYMADAKARDDAPKAPTVRSSGYSVHRGRVMPDKPRR